MSFAEGWFYPASKSESNWAFRFEFRDSTEPFEELVYPPGPPSCPTSGTSLTSKDGRRVCYIVGGGNDIAWVFLPGAWYQLDIALPTKLTSEQRQQFFLHLADLMH